MSDENTDTGTDAEEMHPAVLLILARMKSNPQEFKLPFHEAHSSVWKFFNKAEKAAVSAADRELAMTKFHQSLMDRILKANDPDEGVALRATIPSSLITAKIQPQAMQQALQSGLNDAFSNTYGTAADTPPYTWGSAQSTQNGKP